MKIWVLCSVGAILGAYFLADVTSGTQTTSVSRRIPKDFIGFLHLFLDLRSRSSASSSSSSSDVIPSSSSSCDSDGYNDNDRDSNSDSESDSASDSASESDSRAVVVIGPSLSQSPPRSGLVGVAHRHRYRPMEDHSDDVIGCDADFLEVPYLVQLGEHGRISCNGAILSIAWILTTATCAYNTDTGEKIPAQRLTMRAGATQRDIGGAVYRVIRVELHPDFSYATNNYDYDFALLQVKGSGFVFSPTVQPIALPERGQRIPGNAEAVVSGWGRWRSKRRGGGWSDSLQSETVRTVPYSDCVTAYWAPPVTPRMFCAGDGTSGPCKGDRGAPLVLNGTLTGLSSWGYKGCRRTGHPGVYGRVANPNIRDWIRRTTNL